MYPPAQIEKAYAGAFEAVRDRWIARARTMSGAAAVPGQLAAWPGFVQTVVTDNVRTNAQHKLITLGLHISIPSGRIGSDEHQTRADLCRRS